MVETTEGTNERPSKACKFGNGPFPRSVGRSLGRGEILQKDPQGDMKLRTNLAMHEVRILPCPCTRLLRLGHFECFEGTWTYIALMMKNGVIFEPIRPAAAELRQFAARAPCLIERAIMANFSEGVWVGERQGCSHPLFKFGVCCARDL